MFWKPGGVLRNTRIYCRQRKLDISKLKHRSHLAGRWKVLIGVADDRQRPSKLFLMPARPVIRKIFDTPDISPNIIPAAQRSYWQLFPWLHHLRYQAGFHSSGLWSLYLNEFLQQLLVWLVKDRIPVLKRKSEQPPVFEEPHPSVLWSDMLWTTGGVLKLDWLDMMLFTPGFIRKITGTTLMDDVQPFFIRSARMSFHTGP